MAQTLAAAGRSRDALGVTKEMVQGALPRDSVLVEFLRYGEIGRRRLAVLVATAAWANWLITLIASVLGVRGLEYTGDAANNIVAALLQTLVVLPSLVAAGVWAWGFGERR